MYKSDDISRNTMAIFTFSICAIGNWVCFEKKQSYLKSKEWPVRKRSQVLKMDEKNCTFKL